MTEMQTLTIGTQTYVLVDGKAIHFDAPQDLSPEEKAQALDNLGAAPADNSPMMLGVEYRTTEKWQNKPVYTMLQNVGSFPSAGAVSYYAIRAGITKILRVKGTAANAGFSVPYTSTDAHLTISGTVYGGAATIIVYVEKGDLNADECIAQVWYIKD